MTETKPPCPRCNGSAALMSAVRAAEIAAAVPIEPSLCADYAIYRARLERCASCATLREGVLCAWCGCFVHFRARPKAASCPHPAGNRWQDV
ncbi:MAG: DUF6171 family protein [Treponema sp.]|nr:DUF6171 family protein [Treponema sp.]